MRIEQDFIGKLELPEDALYGIHSLRAKENFPNSIPFQLEWYKAMGQVKLACFNTYAKFKLAAEQKLDSAKLPIQFFSEELIAALKAASKEVSEGQHFDHLVVPAIQGGAGTSINMNVNEIISNRALLILGYKLGNYKFVDPFEHANVFQSTNDVVPSALKVASMNLLDQLEQDINALRNEVEQIEGKYRNVLRQSYTQMQAAVPSTYDKLFSTYNNALSRDWWRVSKCSERIKEVNLGGGAIGTGLSIPRFFIMQVVSELQHLSGQPITRSENLSDTTSNLDSFVEVHATLKAHAVNLEKMVNDLRLLGADLFTNRELVLPQRQVGSSIMPGKVNPVIPEFVISSVHKVYANDLLISNLSGQGCLELNAYIPVIGQALLESIQLLINANKSILDNIMRELKINNNNEHTYFAPSIATALIPNLGYHKSSLLSNYMKEHKATIFEANEALKLIKPDQLIELMKPEALVRQGYSLKDLKND